MHSGIYTHDTKATEGHSLAEPHHSNVHFWDLKQYLKKIIRTNKNYVFFNSEGYWLIPFSVFEPIVPVLVLLTGACTPALDCRTETSLCPAKFKEEMY